MVAPPPKSDGFLLRDRTMSESSSKSTAIDHGPPVSSGPGWNDPSAALLALAKKKQAGGAGAATNTVNAITSPITRPLAMGGGGAEPDQAPPPMGGMGMGSNPPMNYGYQQPQQQNYYGGGGSGAPAPAFEQQQQLPPSQPQNAGFAG